MHNKSNTTGPKSTVEADKPEFSLIPVETLRELYANLVKASVLEEGVRRGRATRGDGWTSVQAASIAVAKDLTANDTIVTARNLPMFDLLLGRKPQAPTSRDKSAKRNGVSERDLLHRGLGAALTQKVAQDRALTVIFWNEVESVEWKQALEAARAHLLPILFVCPAGTDAAASRSTRVKSRLVPGTELPRIGVDGFDAVAVYRVAHESIERARRGRGATLVECASFRVQGQRGGNHRDSIANMERYLRGKGMLQQGARHEIAEQFRKVIAVGGRRAGVK